jgi:hypothetical protein
MVIPERRFVPKHEVIWLEYHMNWSLCLWCCYVITFIFASFIHVHKSSCYLWCIHEIHLVHIHAIGVPRIVSRAKSHKAWTPKLGSIQEPKVPSDEAREDAGAVREAEPEAFLWRLRQAPKHYKTPYFSKQILYMCYMYCCITYRSWVKPLLHWYHSLSRYMNLNPM